MRNTLLLGTALLAGSIAFAGTANADIIADFSVNGGATQTYDLSTNNYIGKPITVGGLSVNFQNIFSNEPGTTSLAELFTSTFGVTNNSSSSETITAVISSSGFESPTAPPAVELSSALSGNVNIGTNAGTISLASAVLEGTTGPTVGSVTSKTLTLAPTGAAASFSDNEYANIALLTAPYTIDQTITLTLVAGDQTTVTATTEVAVPEPASLALLGVGMIGTGVMARRRRQSLPTLGAC